MNNSLGIRRKIYNLLVRLGIEKEQPCKIPKLGINHTIIPENPSSLEDWSKEFNFGQATLFSNGRDISSIVH